MNNIERMARALYNHEIQGLPPPVTSWAELREHGLGESFIARARAAHDAIAEPTEAQSVAGQVMAQNYDGRHGTLSEAVAVYRAMHEAGKHDEERK